jgi:hypothetical protein
MSEREDAAENPAEGRPGRGAHPEPAPSDGTARPDRVVVLTRLSWVGILLLTALFHVIRGAPVDAWIYGLGAGVLVLDQLGWLRIPLRLTSDRDTLPQRIVAGVLIVVAALAFGVSPLYGTVDTAVVVGIGVLLLPVAWADRERPASSRERPEAERRALRRAAYLWSAVIAGGCLWEIGAFFLGRLMPGGTQDFPALSDLMDPVLAWPPARAVLAALWLLGGYVLVRRGWRR